MVQALKKPASDPDYLEFFGLQRPPFAGLSEPSQVYLTEQYSLLMAHLGNATEQPDSLVVILGADGSGKTTLLNRYIASLGDEIYFATIDKDCESDGQFYGSFLRQLGFGEITGKPGELQRITREFLVHRAMAGDPVLLIVDNAHLVNPKVLEQLRWASSIVVNDVRALSVVLAGHTDLLRIMDSPAMSQVEFRNHVRFHIRAYTEEETAGYVWHRMKLAGGMDGVRFPDEALPLVYRYSGGTPGLVNVLCDAVLTEAHALKSRVITEDLLRSVADSRRLVPHVVPLQGKGRRRTDPDFKLEQTKRQPAVREPVEENAPEAEKALERSAKAPARPEPQAEVAEQRAAGGGAAREAVAPPEPDSAPLPGQDVDVGDLLGKISRLSEQVGELKGDRKRALQDVGVRDKALAELRTELDARSAEVGRLKSTCDDRRDEVERLSRALSVSTDALHQSEAIVQHLNTDLEKETSAAKIAQAELRAATAKIQELSRLQRELDTASATLASNEQDIGRLESELAAANQASSRVAAELEQANARVAELEVLDKTAAELRTEIDAKSAELRSLGDELRSREDAVTALQAELDSAQAESESLRARAMALENLEGTVSDKDVRIVDLETQLATLGSEAEKLRARNQALEDEAGAAGKMQADLAAAVAKLESRVADKDAALAELDTQLAALSEETEQLRARNEVLEERAEAASARGSELDAAVERLQGTASDKDARIEELETRLAALSGETGQLRDSNQALQEEAGAAQAVASELAAANAKLEELDSLTSELGEARAALAKSEERLGRVQDELSDAGEANRLLRADLERADAQQSELEALEKTTAELRYEIDRKAGELMALRDELATRRDSVTGLEERLREAQEECESLRAAAAEDLDSRLAEKDTRIADLEAEVAGLDRELEAGRAEVVRLQEERESADEEPGTTTDRARLEAELEIANEQIEAAQGQLADQLAMVHAMQEELNRYRDLASGGDAAEADSAARGLRSERGAAKVAGGSAAAAARGIVAALQILKGGEIENQVTIEEDQRRVMIGRSEDNDVVLDSQFVSGHHALIQFSDEGNYIEDLNSRNGTLVNAKGVLRSELRAGDLVTIGDRQIRLILA